MPKLFDTKWKYGAEEPSRKSSIRLRKILNDKKDEPQKLSKSENTNLDETVDFQISRWRNLKIWKSWMEITLIRTSKKPQTILAVLNGVKTDKNQLLMLLGKKYDTKPDWIEKDKKMLWNCLSKYEQTVAKQDPPAEEVRNCKKRPAWRNREKLEKLIKKLLITENLPERSWKEIKANNSKTGDELPGDWYWWNWKSISENVLDP